jgi:DNA-binding NarL/FixJ family response regulator
VIIRMIKPETMALIVAKPGQFREGLQAMLTSIPQIKQVSQVDDAPSALRMVAQHSPALVLLDFDLSSGDALAVALKQIKATWPQSQCIALVHNAQEYQLAKAAGADVIRMKGVPATQLLAVVKELLSRPET